MANSIQMEAELSLETSTTISTFCYLQYKENKKFKSWIFFSPSEMCEMFLSWCKERKGLEIMIL